MKDSRQKVDKGLMAPEAYTLEAIFTAFTDDFNARSIHAAAAGAYAKYQKCSLTAAKRLFVPYSKNKITGK